MLSDVLILFAELGKPDVGEVFCSHCGYLCNNSFSDKPCFSTAAVYLMSHKRDMWDVNLMCMRKKNYCVNYIHLLS